MVHVKQYAPNEMCDIDKPTTNKLHWKPISVCTETTEY